MPLITCPDCGKEVSERAPTCPHCGGPIARGSAPSSVHGGGEGCFLKTLNVGCLVLVGFVVLVIAVAIGLSEADPPVVPDQPTHLVGADSLVWCPDREGYDIVREGLMEDALIAEHECGFFARGDSVTLVRTLVGLVVVVRDARGEDVWTTSVGLEPTAP